MVSCSDSTHYNWMFFAFCAFVLGFTTCLYKSRSGINLVIYVAVRGVYILRGILSVTESAQVSISGKLLVLCS